MNELLKGMAAAAARAAREILAVYEDSERFAMRREKADHSPLTEADEASHRSLAASLGGLLPGLPLLSEEGAQLPYALRRAWPRFWLLDPLDGTKEFLQRNGEFCINIALIEGGQPVAACVQAPVSGEAYVAARGGGAWRLRPGGQAERLQAALFDPRQPGLRILVSRSHLNESTRQYIARFDRPQLVPMGSALKFVEIAASRADLYPRFGPTMEWDSAAPQLLVEEAGGQVLACESLQPLAYGKADLRNPDFIVRGRMQEA
jgi:3'(2'), 5'-bisphosphate nucleotidase